MIRNQLHQFIDKAKDNEIQAMFLILGSKIEETNGRVSIEQYNREVNEAVKQYKDGNFITQEQLEKEIKSW